MTTRDKLEKVLEYIINEESEKASDLLHDVFVEKARTVYEDLMGQDEDLEEYEEEINTDEIEEEEDPEEMEMGMDDAEADVADDMAMDIAPDMEADDEEAAPDEIESNFEKVEDAIEELRQSFQAILGDEMKDEDDEMESVEMEEEEIGAMESVEEDEEETTTESAETEEEELEEDLNEEEEDEELDEDFDYVDESATLTAVKTPHNTSEKSHSPVAKAGNKPGGPVSSSMMKDAGAEGKKAHMAPKMMNTGNVNVPGAKQKLASVAMPKSSEAAGNTTSPNNGM